MRRAPVIKFKTKIPGFALLLLTLAWLTATKSQAQFYPPIFYPPFGYPRPYPRPHDPPPEPKDAPIEIGGYGMFGGAIEETPPPHKGTIIGAAGMYAQWNRYGLCPGLDLRIQGNGSQLHGYLVGPRVAYQPRRENMRPFRLFAEALFGKNEVSYSPDSSGLFTIPATEHVGVTRSIVFGLDLHVTAPFDWRVIEFSKGDFTGLPGSYPQTLQTGILFHFP